MGRQSLRTKASRTQTSKQKLSSITADREDAIAQMNAPLQRKLHLIEKQVNDLRAENLMYYYKIGKVCEEIRNDPKQYVGKDGTSGLKLIERSLATQARTLRKAAAFAREYTEEQLQSLVSMVNTATKFCLHWGHVSFLLTVPAERRERFAQEAVQNMLDPPALHDLIKKRLHKSGGHGRKHEMPKTINAQIRQILTVCRQWTGKNDNVWNGEDASVYANILNMPADDMEPDMVEQLAEIETLMIEIADAAGSNVDKTRRVREHITQSIERRDAQAAAVNESGRQARAIDLTGDGTGSRRRPAAADAS